MRRLGDALTLTSGEPSNDCERARWVDLAPAIVTRRSRGDVFSSRTQTLGYGLFPRDGTAPLSVDDMIPRMVEPRLAATPPRVLARSIRRRDAVSTGLEIAGDLARVVGFNLLVWTIFSDSDSAAETGLMVIVISEWVGRGLLPAIAALVGPGDGESSFEGARRRLFIVGEDEMSAVARGVARYNAGVRATCRAR